MLFQLALKCMFGALAIALLGAGGYALVKEGGTRALSRTLNASLASGDYLAALAAAEKLKDSGEETPELEEKIGTAARLLVATDALKKAKTAFDEKRFAMRARFFAQATP